MAINVATLAPASLKSKNVATEQYVDTSVASIDVSPTIAANNDVFAQKLGYANYAAMVNAAASGQTVVNGGYINTGLINTNAINANQINTTGLIAENISASSSIQGNSIYGSYIEGAYISGAVIHASYLDLNGELTVMTDWSSSTQLGYSFPVVVNGTTYYRLNTVSSISDSDGVTCSPTPGSPSHIVNLYGSNYTVYDSGSVFLNDGGLYSYDSYSTNTSLRARRVRPTISFPDTSAIVVGGSSVGQGSKTVDIYLFGRYFGRAVLDNTYGSTSASFAGYSGNTTFSLYGITFKLEHYWYEISNPSGWPVRVSYAGLSIVAGTYTITFDWSNQSPLCKYVLLSSATSAGGFPAFTINNM